MVRGNIKKYKVRLILSAVKERHRRPENRKF